LPRAGKSLPFCHEKFVCEFRISDGNNPALQCPKCTDPAMPEGDILDETMWLKG
jgi:hypothetical protein